MKLNLLLAALVCASGCVAAPSGNDSSEIMLSNLRDTVSIPAIPGWKLYGRLPTTPVRLVSFYLVQDPKADFAHRLPTGTITFELLPAGTTEVDILAGPSLRGSVPDRTTSISVSGIPRTLHCRRGDIVDECFVLIPLRESLLEASLTVSTPTTKYFATLKAQFCDAITRLKLP
ncbi:MAG: hypothetical protein WCE51_16045 [Chthoniobacterales bacterium]